MGIYCRNQGNFDGFVHGEGRKQAAGSDPSSKMGVLFLEIFFVNDVLFCEINVLLRGVFLTYICQVVSPPIHVFLAVRL